MEHGSNKTNTPLDAKQLEALRVAVYLSGGAARVAQRMGYLTGESVRRFFQGLKPVPAEKAALLREAIERRLTLTEIRPDIYAGLTVEALGYRPKDGK